MTAAEVWRRAVAEGDEQARSELFERYRPFVIGRIRRAAAARNWFWLDDADELAQAVLVRFFEAARDGRFVYRDEEQLRGYLVRTIFFLAMKRKDAAALERPWSELAGDDDPAARFEPLRFVDAAFEEAARRECRGELYAAIERLQPARREVLKYTLLGLAPREIAPRMGRTANAVSVLKFHALEDLRAELEASGFATDCARFWLEHGE